MSIISALKPQQFALLDKTILAGLTADDVKSLSAAQIKTLDSEKLAPAAWGAAKSSRSNETLCPDGGGGGFPMPSTLI